MRILLFSKKCDWLCDIIISSGKCIAGDKCADEKGLSAYWTNIFSKSALLGKECKWANTFKVGFLSFSVEKIFYMASVLFQMAIVVGRMGQWIESSYIYLLLRAGSCASVLEA